MVSANYRVLSLFTSIRNGYVHLLCSSHILNQMSEFSGGGYNCIQPSSEMLTASFYVVTAGGLQLYVRQLQCISLLKILRYSKLYDAVETFLSTNVFSIILSQAEALLIHLARNALNRNDGWCLAAIEIELQN